jgi:hypothetical protein
MRLIMIPLLGVAILGIAGCATTSIAQTGRLSLRITMRRPLLITIVALALQFASLRGSTATIEVNDPRPIAKAVQTLVSQYGYVITYEDPRYNYMGDLEDVTAKFTRWNKRPEMAPKIIVPAMGKITVSLPATSGLKDVASALGVLAQQRSEHGGHFRVQQSADVFHVIPTEARDPDGNWSANPSILDVPISLPAHDYSEHGMMQAICSAVGVLNHVEVHAGGGDVGLGIRPAGPETLYHLEAKNESARTVLLRALSTSSTRRRTWQLLYDYTVKAYYLNILEVPDVRAVPQQRSVPKAPQQISPCRAVDAWCAAPPR